MSDTIVARAPGKLFLLGEYAVLDGCSAVVAAIDRHVEVSVRRDVRSGLVKVRSSAGAAVDFPATRPPAIDGALRFVVAAFVAARARCPQLGRFGWSVTTASTMDGPGGAKVGLGSSAAVTVATIAALLAAADADCDNCDSLFALALQAHRAAQDAVGSGADVAASVYGGLILFEPRAEGVPVVKPLTWPAQTTMLAAWSGESASTTNLVRQYLASWNGKAAARAAFVDASRSSVELFVSALSDGALAHAAIDTNAAALERLGTELGLAVMTPRLTQLIVTARAHGAAAKVSGAGGGDCGIALTSDAAAAGRIRNAWRAAQLEPIDIALDQNGVTIARG